MFIPSLFNPFKFSLSLSQTLPLTWRQLYFTPNSLDLLSQTETLLHTQFHEILSCCAKCFEKIQKVVINEIIKKGCKKYLKGFDLYSFDRTQESSKTSVRRYKTFFRNLRLQFDSKNRRLLCQNPFELHYSYSYWLYIQCRKTEAYISSPSLEV